jgi:hypothetical protein
MKMHYKEILAMRLIFRANPEADRRVPALKYQYAEQSKRTGTVAPGA